MTGQLTTWVQLHTPYQRWMQRQLMCKLRHTKPVMKNTWIHRTWTECSEKVQYEYEYAADGRQNKLSVHTPWILRRWSVDMAIVTRGDHRWWRLLLAPLCILFLPFPSLLGHDVPCLWRTRIKMHQAKDQICRHERKLVRRVGDYESFRGRRSGCHCLVSEPIYPEAEDVVFFQGVHKKVSIHSTIL